MSAAVCDLVLGLKRIGGMRRRLLLYVLALHADDDGRCTVNGDDLLSELEMPVALFRAMAQRLEDLGWIVTRGRSYRLRISKLRAHQRAAGTEARG